MTVGPVFPTTFDPIVNGANLYINGMSLGVTDFVNTLDIFDGLCRDSTNTDDIVVSTTEGFTILNLGINGANGLDSGTFNTGFYTIFAIGDATGYQPSAYIGSLNLDTPVMPYGYDLYRRIGYIKAEAGNITPFSQYGNSNDRIYNYVTAIQVLTNGAATTWTDVDLSAAIPNVNNSTTPINPDIPVFMYLQGTPSSVGDLMSVRPPSSSSFTGLIPITYQAPIAGVNISMTSEMLIGSAIFSGVTKPAVQYYGSSSSDLWNIFIIGYRDSL
jgi:hypothetical protein